MSWGYGKRDAFFLVQTKMVLISKKKLPWLLGIRRVVMEWEIFIVVDVKHLLSFFLSFLHKVRKGWLFTPRVRWWWLRSVEVFFFFFWEKWSFFWVMNMQKKEKSRMRIKESIFPPLPPPSQILSIISKGKKDNFPRQKFLDRLDDWWW